MSNWSDEELQKVFEEYRAKQEPGKTIIVRDFLRHALAILCPTPNLPAQVHRAAPLAGVHVRAADSTGNIVYDHIRPSINPAADAHAMIQLAEYQRLADTGSTFKDVPIGTLFVSTQREEIDTPAQAAGRSLPRTPREYLNKGRFKHETEGQAALAWAGWCEARGNHMLSEFLKDVAPKLENSPHTEWPEPKPVSPGDTAVTKQYSVGWNEAIIRCRRALAPPTDVLVVTAGWRRLVMARPGPDGQYIAQITDLDTDEKQK